MANRAICSTAGVVRPGFSINVRSALKNTVDEDDVLAADTIIEHLTLAKYYSLWTSSDMTEVAALVGLARCKYENRPHEQAAFVVTELAKYLTTLDD